jgi:hypothetical protein
METSWYVTPNGHKYYEGDKAMARFVNAKSVLKSILILQLLGPAALHNVSRAIEMEPCAPSTRGTNLVLVMMDGQFTSCQHSDIWFAETALLRSN